MERGDSGDCSGMGREFGDKCKCFYLFYFILYITYLNCRDNSFIDFPLEHCNYSLCLSPYPQLVFARLLVLHKREIFSKMVDSTPPRHDLHTTVSATVASLVSSETRLSQVDEEQQARSSAAWSVEDEQRIRMEMESIRTEMATVEIARSPLVGSSELQSPKRQAEMSKLESPRLVDRDSGVFIPMHIPAITPIPTSVPMPTSMAIPDLPPNLVPHQETSSKPVPSSINDPTSTSRPRPPAYAARLHTSLMGPRGPRKTPYQSRSGNVGVGARTRKDLDV